MSIYDAILAAADHIEKYPQCFEFTNARVPSDRGDTGCALGWIGYFLNKHAAEFPGPRHWHDEVALDLLRVPRGYSFLSTSHIYERIECLAGTSRWMDEADICAKALRRYAKKYHAPPQMPDAVLALFVARALDEVAA
jgi:hypothetical protein